VSASASGGDRRVVGSKHGPDRRSLRAIAEGLERELRAAGTPHRAAKEKAYLKSSLEHAGASLPAIRACGTRLRRRHPDLDTGELLSLAGELWSARCTNVGWSR
jgi:DNA alkylation repair enzyme